ncbi:hypothetical protein AKJ40_04960, partial [candidate division MSBL1 archaeon SCGC-AAA259M10]
GIAMAYRCGAELHSLEFQHWHHSDTLYPNSARRLVHNYPDFSEKKQFLGNDFYEKHGISPGTEISTIVDEDGNPVIKELKENIATDDSFHSPNVQRVIAKRFAKRGELFMRYDKSFIETGELEDIYYNYRVIKNFYDPKEEDIPLGTSAHTSCGGLKVSEKCETTVPGLFGAGGAIGIYPTVNTCLWSGETSAKYASERAEKIGVSEPNTKQINAEKRRVESFLRSKPDDGLIPSQVQKKIRDLMWDKMWIIKNREGIKEAISGLQKIREEDIPKMGLESTTRKGNFAWLHALEVINMLTVSELMARASLKRKESRGSHVVEEYPEKNDDNWRKIIVIKQEKGEPKIEAEKPTCPRKAVE